MRDCFAAILGIDGGFLIYLHYNSPEIMDRISKCVDFVSFDKHRIVWDHNRLQASFVVVAELHNSFKRTFNTILKILILGHVMTRTYMKQNNPYQSSFDSSWWEYELYSPLSPYPCHFISPSHHMRLALSLECHPN